MLVVAAISVAVVLLNARRVRREAIENAKIVISALESADEAISVESLTGRRVTFHGCSVPPCSSANLVTEEGITIDVELVPRIDPRPTAILWTARVTGIIKAIDVRKRIVFLRVKKGDWVLTESW
jgi:hypothetical protein